MTAGRDLVVFAPFYPFGDYDWYLDDEMRRLAPRFERVVVVSAEVEGRPARAHPRNVTPVRFRPRASLRSKLSYARYLLDPVFRREMAAAQRASPGAARAATARSILSAMSGAHEYLSLLRRLFDEHRLTPHRTVIYNYWMLEHAYASALFKKEHPGVTVVSRAHSSDLYFDRSPIGYLPLKKATFDALDALYFISERGRDYFTALHGISPSDTRLRVGRLGVPDYGAPPERPPQQPFRVVSNAFISPIKRIDLLAAALARIDDVALEWVHFGDVYNDERAFAAFQTHVTQRLAAVPNVRVVFKGRVAADAIPAYYRSHPVDLFVNVSTTEGIPVSLMEAIAFGIPVVGTNVGGNPEIVDDHDGALLPSNPTVDQVAEVIRRFARLSEDQRRAYRASARARWDERFNAAKNYSAFAEEIAELTPSRPPA
jgi:glycosyltransferase involved in cell wall biosynthesis